MGEFILKQLQDVFYFSAVLNSVFENASFMKTTCKSFWWWNHWLPTATCLHTSSEDSGEPTQQLKRRKRKNLEYIFWAVLLLEKDFFFFNLPVNLNKRFVSETKIWINTVFIFVWRPSWTRDLTKLIKSLHSPLVILHLKTVSCVDPDLHCGPLVHRMSFFM